MDKTIPPVDTGTGTAAGTAAQSASLADLLGALAGQIRDAMAITHEPMETLVATVHDMQQATQILALGVMDFSGQPARVFEDLVNLHNDLAIKSSKSITAVQFHDRHVQILTRVCDSLSFMADAIARNHGALSAADAAELDARVQAVTGEPTIDIF
jgi:hypothetical protein